MALIFPHIPKTAGTTFLNILEQIYPRPVQFHTFRGSRANRVGEFLDLPEAERARYELVCGHMNFGLHDYIPGPCTYVTFLRDPIQRVVSHFSWIKRNTEHFLHDDCRLMSLREFVESRVTTEIDNGQTRVMAGVANVPPILYPLDRSEAEVPFGACGRELLAQATNNLDQMAVVGLVESFETSVALMSAALGWGCLPDYPNLNVDPSSHSLNRDRPSHHSGASDPDSTDSATIELIRSVNLLDLELYRHAERRLAALASRYDTVSSASVVSTAS